ncbi:hypothetical protein EDB92DRAFT_1817794 [Lactarius akahatsu]|uniref:Uncharacterized protein n=1 Tax=Lactarius akahatsu TaxID=416441 RepID=A0AAD4LE81_9AGAM|nr:hypothetical protein EDB92DRAFT_1817794 [Lactarius akahatsu]
MTFSTTIGSIASAGSLLGLGGAAVKGFEKVMETPEALLKLCMKDLDEIRSLLGGLTPRQKEEIYVLARQKKCRSLQDIELDMHERTKNASFRDRIPLSQLRSDIRVLKTAVEGLLHDTWTTTSFPSTEAKRERLRQAENQPPLPLPSAGPEEYSLDDVRPPTARYMTGHSATELPAGLV